MSSFLFRQLLDIVQSYNLNVYFTVTKSTNFDNGFNVYMCLMSDNTVVVCGREGNQWKLKRFDQRETEISYIELKDQPSGITEVILDGKTVLALSYR